MINGNMVPKPASWTEVYRSDQDRIVALKVPRQYLVSRYALDFLTVLLKNMFQIGWAEGLERSSQLFKGRTGDGAPDPAIHVKSREPDALGKPGPKEKISELKLTTSHFVDLLQSRGEQVTSGSVHGKRPHSRLGYRVQALPRLS